MWWRLMGIPVVSLKKSNMPKSLKSKEMGFPVYKTLTKICISQIYFISSSINHLTIRG